MLGWLILWQFRTNKLTNNYYMTKVNWWVNKKQCFIVTIRKPLIKTRLKRLIPDYFRCDLCWLVVESSSCSRCWPRRPRRQPSSPATPSTLLGILGRNWKNKTNWKVISNSRQIFLMWLSLSQYYFGFRW